MVWKPSNFLTGEMETLPYQHDKVILYRAINPEEFFEGGGSVPHISESALKDQYIWPDNSYYTEEEGGIENIFENFSIENDGLFFGYPSVSEYFASKLLKQKRHSCIIKTVISTETLHTFFLKRRYRRAIMNGENIGFKFTSKYFGKASNLKELRKEFDEPGFESPVDAFRNYSRIAAQTDPHGENPGLTELVQFAIQEGINVRQIKSVWDYEFRPNQVHYQPFQDYIKDLKGRYRSSMPSEINEDELKNEIIKLEAMEIVLAFMEEDAENIAQLIDTLSNPFKNTDLYKNTNKEKKFLKRAENNINNSLWGLETRLKDQSPVEWNKLLKLVKQSRNSSLNSVLKNNMSVSIDYVRGYITIKELAESLADRELDRNTIPYENLLKEPEKIKKPLENAIKACELDLRESKGLISAEDISKEELKQHLERKHSLEENIIQNIERLPDIRPALEKINNNEQEFQVSMEELRNFKKNRQARTPQ